MEQALSPPLTHSYTGHRCNSGCYPRCRYVPCCLRKPSPNNRSIQYQSNIYSCHLKSIFILSVNPPSPPRINSHANLCTVIHVSDLPHDTDFPYVIRIIDDLRVIRPYHILIRICFKEFVTGSVSATPCIMYFIIVTK